MTWNARLSIIYRNFTSTIKFDQSFYFSLNNINPGTFEGHVFEESEVEFCVQEDEVISALNLVVPLMNFGEKCEVIADPEFAYGKAGHDRILFENLTSF